ncbi:MAG TPA: DUF4238 domain-containing protein [Candidatus Saccharimonadia bacterium]|nr:DUF4238 domain-containing protein [Candidatus Saccharimonadia bacterium]
MRSHLLSQVVLKRFANDAKEVERHDIATDAVTIAATTEVAYRDVETDLIKDLEQEWSRDIENNGTKALNALENGDLLHHSDHVLTVKHLIGLHYIRSAIFVMTDRQSDQYRTRVIESTAAEYPEHRAEIEATANSQWPHWEQSVAVKTLQDYLPKIQTYIETHGLEVCVAPDGAEFILGDIPVVTSDGDGRFGVFQGVSLTDARACAMPLTPHHLVALKTNQTTDRYHRLTAGQVTAANDKERMLAIEAYYKQPANPPTAGRKVSNE